MQNLLITLILVMHIFSCTAGSEEFLPKNLNELETVLKKEKQYIAYLSCNFKKRSIQGDGKTYDVAILGGGMAGLTTAVALFKEGITNIKIIDQNPEGFEGPWVTYAKMNCLLSNKLLMGPAMDIPSLTFQAWFLAKYGQAEWEKFTKAPREIWMEYLKWYRQVMELPVENNCKVLNLTPQKDFFEIEFEKNGQIIIVTAKKVVLATGRTGFGGPSLPDYAKKLPKENWAHSTEVIDYSALKGKSVAVIGAGCSGYDVAGEALKCGADKVDILMRRSKLPNQDIFSQYNRKIYHSGFYYMPDEWRWRVLTNFYRQGVPPSQESIRQNQQYKKFKLLNYTHIDSAVFEGNQINFQTNHGQKNYDFVIFATGFRVNGRDQPELKNVIEQISLWSDHLSEEILKDAPEFGNYPYLGPTFEFLEKVPGNAPYLKNLYCFNFGASMSHGFLNTEIPSISLAAKRLAEGISVDFFKEDNKYIPPPVNLIVMN